MIDCSENICKMMTSNIHLRLLPIVFLTTLLSCFAFDLTAQTVSPKEEQGPKLLFLNYSFIKTDTSVPEVNFLGKTITKGRRKDHSNKVPLNSPGAIRCVQYDKFHKELESTYFENPLKPIVEYLNDDGAFEKRQLDLDKAELAIKLQLNENTTTIDLFLIDIFGNATTKLITNTIP